jgi:acyl carrier protein
LVTTGEPSRRDRERPTAEVLKQIRDIVIEVAPTASTSVSPATRLVDDLGYDSLRLVELGMVLEEEFDLSTKLGDISVETIAQLQELTLRLLDREAR